MLDREEMEKLFRSHYGKMYKLARCILHDDEESKDVVSDVFAKIMDSNYVPAPDKIPGYLLISTRNKCYDVISHRHVLDRMRRLYPMDTSIDLSPVDTDKERIEAMLIYAEKELTPQTYNVFRMRFDDGKRYKEIADSLGISITAVYKHLSQALSKLRAHFH